MKFQTFLFLLSILTINSCKGQASKNVKNITLEFFAKKIESTPKAQIIDVRTPNEYENGHLINALILIGKEIILILRQKN